MKAHQATLATALLATTLGCAVDKQYTAFPIGELEANPPGGRVAITGVPSTVRPDVVTGNTHGMFTLGEAPGVYVRRAKVWRGEGDYTEAWKRVQDEATDGDREPITAAGIYNSEEGVFEAYTLTFPDGTVIPFRDARF